MSWSKEQIDLEKQQAAEQEAAEQEAEKRRKFKRMLEVKKTCEMMKFNRAEVERMQDSILTDKYIIEQNERIHMAYDLGDMQLGLKMFSNLLYKLAVRAKSSTDGTIATFAEQILKG